MAINLMGLYYYFCRLFIMNVQNVTPIQLKRYLPQQQKENADVAVTVVNEQTPGLYSSGIAFTGIHNIVPKRLNIDLESKKLVKQISEILETDTSDLSPEDLLLTSMSKMLSNFRNIQMKMNKLIEKLDLLDADTRMPSKQKLDLLNAYRKEFKTLDKMKITPAKSTNAQSTVDERIDFQLLNRFKVALSKEDYGLLRVYKDYYSGLESVKDLDELAQKYPKIKLPPRPEMVVSKKIVSTLTRDFYEQLHELALKENYDGIYQMMHKVVKSLCDNLTVKYNVDSDSAYRRLSEDTYKAILDKYKDIRAKDSFTSIPINRKVKEPQITPLDIAMLRVDFDGFVLDVLKRQYLNSEKLNDIVYEANGVKIPVKSLGNTEYKMAKASEKTRRIITMAEKIKEAQRDYDAFTTEELKARLIRFASGKAGHDDILFEKIIEFDSCRFEPDDIVMLRQFLRKLDDFEDGVISLDDLHGSIISENIRPKGSELLDELERKNLADELKLEQRKVFELTSLQDDFDKMIDTLYSNNMSTIAGICSKYRPLSLDPDSVSKAKHLVSLVLNQIDSSDLSRANLESKIVNWDTYNFYLVNKSTDSVFQKAQLFARNADGTIDIDKAGHYIATRELVDNYPKSISFAKYPEFLKKLMSKVSDPDEAVEYLFKYDKYFELPEIQKSQMSILEEMFDLKSPSDKFVLKHIVEEEYANIGTKVSTRLNDKGSETTESIFHPAAKLQIINKYMFPTCISYLKAFEEALSTVAPSRGATGIKINKGLSYRLEAKNKAFEDRLLSSKDDYVFDIYLDKGLH